MSRREYSARVFDAVTRRELHTDIGHGPHGQVVRIISTATDADNQVVANLTPDAAAVLLEQALNLGNLIRDNQAQGRPA